MSNHQTEKLKSQCCNEDIEKDRGGIGVFALTTGAYICSKCHHYCCRKPEFEMNPPSDELEVN